MSWGKLGNISIRVIAVFALLLCIIFMLAVPLLFQGDSESNLKKIYGGWLYLVGNICINDRHEKEKFYLEASDYGYSEADLKLGDMAYKDYKDKGEENKLYDAILFYKIASAGKVSVAESRLSGIYAEALNNEKILTDAVEWYEAVAGLGIVESDTVLFTARKHLRDYLMNSGDKLYEEYKQSGSTEKLQEVIEYYKKLCVEGIDGAEERLAALYAAETENELVLVDAVAWYEAVGQLGVKRKLIDYERAVERLNQYYFGVAQKYRVENNDSAEKYYLLSAERGYVPAEFELGVMYQFGILVEKNEDNAIKWFEQAYKQKNVSAAAHLGVIYLNKGGKDINKGLKLLKMAAAQADEYAAISLALAYYKGNNVEKNPEYSERYFKLCAEIIANKLSNNEYTDDQNRYLVYLGVMNMLGNGVTKDIAKGIDFLTKAAEQGDADAQCYLALYYYCDGNNLPEALKWFEKSAKQGNAQAMYYISIMYFNGQGVEKNSALGTQWLEQSAENNYDDAQYLLGLMYLTDEQTDSVAKTISFDCGEGLKWIRKAVKQNNAAAILLLSNIYLEGKIVEKNNKLALELCRIAADDDLPEAEYTLGGYYYNGKIVEKDMEKAFYYFNKAALAGIAEAQYAVSICYRDGVGVEKNQQESEIWLSKAVAQDKKYSYGTVGGRLYYSLSKELPPLFEEAKAKTAQGYEIASDFALEGYQWTEDALSKGYTQAKDSVIKMYDSMAEYFSEEE